MSGAMTPDTVNTMALLIHSAHFRLSAPWGQFPFEFATADGLLRIEHFCNFFVVRPLCRSSWQQNSHRQKVNYQRLAISVLKLWTRLASGCKKSARSSTWLATRVRDRCES